MQGVRRGLQDHGAHRIAALNHAGRRLLGRRADPCELEHCGVGHAEMARDIAQPDRIVGGGTVELGCGGITPLGELALIPPTAQDPFAGFGGFGPLGHSIENVLQALGIVQIDLEQLLQSAAHDGGVGS
jgi:hypothetical protein